MIHHGVVCSLPASPSDPRSFSLNLELYCFISGRDSGTFLSVKIANTDSGRTLKEGIKEKKLVLEDVQGLEFSPSLRPLVSHLQKLRITTQTRLPTAQSSQPGIGAFSLLIIENRLLNTNAEKSCFLYYVLFRRLCEKKPVALKLYLVFQDGGVYIHPLRQILIIASQTRLGLFPTPVQKTINPVMPF